MKYKTRIGERMLNSNLHLAALEGNLLKVKELLNEGANIDALDATGHSPFYVALKNNHLEIAKFLNKSKYPDAEYLSYNVMESIKEAIDFDDIIAIKDLLFKRYNEFKEDALEYARSRGKINIQTCIAEHDLGPLKINQNQLDHLIIDNINSDEFTLSIILEAYNYYKDLSHLTIDGLTLKHIKKIDFSNINFQNSKMTNISLEQVSFQNSDLTEARISFAPTQGQVDFSQANLTRCFIKGLYANQAFFQDTIMRDTMMDSSRLENLSPQQQLQIIDLTLTIDAAFNQNKLIKSNYLLNQSGICLGLCVELARYTLRSIEKGEGYGNFIDKLNKKVKDGSINFIYRVRSFQNTLQEQNQRIYIKTSDINHNNFLASLSNEIVHSDIIGCSVSTIYANHIFTVTKIRNENNTIIGYKIFEPNFGEYSPKTDLEANQYINLIFQYYQVDVHDKESSFRVIALDDLVKRAGLINPKNTPISEIDKPNKYLTLSSQEILEMTLESGKPIPQHSKEIERLLLSKAFPLEHLNSPVRTNDGLSTTLLHMMATANMLDFIKLLVSNGVDLNQVNSSGLTALHFAALHGSEQMVQYMLDHGAKLNIPNTANVTPLMMAARGKRFSIVKLLLKAGEAPNMINIYGETPVSLNPRFFTDAAIITIFKEVIDDNDIKSMGNLLKYYSHLKNKVITKTNGTLFLYALRKDNPKMLYYLLQEGFTPNGAWPDKAVEYLSSLSSEEKDALLQKFSHEKDNPLINLLKPPLDKENINENITNQKPSIITKVRHIPSPERNNYFAPLVDKENIDENTQKHKPAIITKARRIPSLYKNNYFAAKESHRRERKQKTQATEDLQHS